MARRRAGGLVISDGGSRPVPDPTLLTSELVDKATAAQAHEFAARLEGLREVLEARLDGMDEAIKLVRGNLEQRPAETDAKIAHLKDIVGETFKTVDEKFAGVEKQFLERDVRVREAAVSATTAVNAALQAAKEAVGEQNKSFSLAVDKSEKATLEQISQQRQQLALSSASLDDKINDIKERLLRIEGRGIGIIEERSEQRATSTSVWGIVGLGIGAAIGVAGLVVAVAAR